MLEHLSLAKAILVLAIVVEKQCIKSQLLQSLTDGSENNFSLSKGNINVIQPTTKFFHQRICVYKKDFPPPISPFCVAFSFPTSFTQDNVPTCARFTQYTVYIYFGCINTINWHLDSFTNKISKPAWGMTVLTLFVGWYNKACYWLTMKNATMMFTIWKIK